MSSRKIIVERIAYTVFPIEGGRRLKTWARIGPDLKPITAISEERLRRKLRKISVDLLNGQTEAAQLDAPDHRSYLAAREIAAPLGLSVDAAVRELAEVRAQLGKIPVMEAVRFYIRHSGQITERKTLAEVIEEFQRLVLSKLSDSYREIFTYDLARLAKFAGDTPLAEVTTGHLETAIVTTGKMKEEKFVPASAFRREQVRGEMVTFFNFARRRGYLPKKLDHVAHALEEEKALAEVRPVWDPEHLRRGLEIVWAHHRDWLPWLAISCLANVRSQATRRLAWSEIYWHDRYFELRAKISKVSTRVTVPISDSLFSWLDPYRGRKGHVCPAKGFGELTRRLREEHELPYYKNVLRKSYITYLLAETDDEEYVARVANTSVSKVRANYRKIRTFADRLVTKDLAKAWFETARVSATNIVQLELGA